MKYLLRTMIIIAIYGLNPAAQAAIKTDGPTLWDHEIMAFYQVVKPLVEVENRTFTLKIAAADPTSISGAEAVEPKNATITLGSDYLKNKNLTADSLRLMMCHELGHIMGSAPRRPAPVEWLGPVDPRDGKLFISAEGEADYFASLKCMRLVLKNSAENSVEKSEIKKNVHPLVRKKCDRVYSVSEASLICQRTAMAAFTLLRLNKDFPISFQRPSKIIVEKTLDSQYPERQCRLDTILAGALCKIPAEVKMDSMDPSVGACSENFGNREGVRPRCWFY